MLIKAFLTFSLLIIPLPLFAQKTREQWFPINADLLPSLTVGTKDRESTARHHLRNPNFKLGFDPRVDMQSRNMAEAQGD
jgi:hypothetical protein